MFVKGIIKPVFLTDLSCQNQPASPKKPHGRNRHDVLQVQAMSTLFSEPFSGGLKVVVSSAGTHITAYKSLIITVL